MTDYESEVTQKADEWSGEVARCTMRQLKSALCPKLLSVLAASSLASGSAFAACPTEDTLRKGAIVFTVDGLEEVHTRAHNGVVTILTGEDGDGMAIQTILARGIYLLQHSEVVHGKLDLNRIWRFSYGAPNESLPAPKPGGSWHGEATSYFDGVADVGNVTHTWGPLEPYTIGACTFASITVRSEYVEGDYRLIEEMIYFPKLETAILVGVSDFNGNQTYVFEDVTAK